MKINLDTTTKTITLLEPVSIAELFELEQIIPSVKDWEIKGKIHEVQQVLDADIRKAIQDAKDKRLKKAKELGWYGTIETANAEF